MFRKWVPALIGFLILFTTSGCFQLTEIINLRSNGSGGYEIVADFSEMLEIMAAMGGDDSDKIPEKMDSVIYLSDIPDSIKSTWKNPEMMNQVTMNLHLDEFAGEAFMRFYVPFKHLNDLSEFWETLGQTMQSESSVGSFMGSGLNVTGDQGGRPSYSLKGKQITRTLDQPFNFGSDEDEIEMMKLLMASGTYTVEYHLPSKVKKIKNQTGVEVSEDGRVVTQKVALLDLLDGTADLSNTIKFK